LLSRFFEIRMFLYHTHLDFEENRPDGHSGLAFSTAPDGLHQRIKRMTPAAGEFASVCAGLYPTLSPAYGGILNLPRSQNGRGPHPVIASGQTSYGPVMSYISCKSW